MVRALTSGLSGVFLLVAAVAHADSAVETTAMTKMAPPGAAEKMRECTKKAMDAGVKMEDRAAFVKNCVGMK